MTTIQKWTSNDPATGMSGNYGGDDMSEFYVGPMRIPTHPNALADSNFEITLDRLGGESDTVQVHYFRHWAYAGYEVILVHQSDTKAITELQAIADELESYPVLDDEDFSQRETDALTEFWQMISMRERIEYLRELDESIFAARAADAYDLYERLNDSNAYYHLEQIANE